MLVVLHVVGALIALGLLLAGLLTPQQLALLVLIYSAVTSWVIGLRMGRTIRKDLGRKANDLDLASIDIWMKVEDVEKQGRGDQDAQSPLSDKKL